MYGGPSELAVPGRGREKGGGVREKRFEVFWPAHEKKRVAKTRQSPKKKISFDCNTLSRYLFSTFLLSRPFSL